MVLFWVPDFKKYNFDRRRYYFPFPRSKRKLNTMNNTVTLDLECYPEELSEVQLQQYEKAEKEHNEIRMKVN